MPPAGFEPRIPASERPQTHALDRAATGISYTQYMIARSFIYKSHTINRLRWLGNSSLTRLVLCSVTPQCVGYSHLFYDMNTTSLSNAKFQISQMRNMKFGMREIFTNFARIIFDLLEITGQTKYKRTHFIRPTALRQCQSKWKERATSNFSVNIRPKNCGLRVASQAWPRNYLSHIFRERNLALRMPLSTTSKLPDMQPYPMLLTVPWGHSSVLAMLQNPLQIPTHIPT
jgi:hypothetical protein